ncbi:Mediator of RNA polymerase II transcription subunit 14 [Cyphellophora attinorum]|uniref:Mediator of RNA polymerase II transcription subunit 14 n=1 Tax=Cyphellophora attinorum TaxID=1664694 RepID=A0A0N1H463_9EURO|nr:Mediator of RNA polymerase II transcription subunit 14 [Phialophora attinorum]KPI40035.1 Mediator of RNA polymerase II transcription subunit 14 [Phialophora attinorum]
MNGEPARVHDQLVPNGAQPSKAPSPADIKALKATAAATAPSVESPSSNNVQTNGNHSASNGFHAPKRDYQAAPEDALYRVSDAHYLPMATLVGRTAQNCWNDLYQLVDQLSDIAIPAQSADPGRPLSYSLQSNNQTKANLDKKDRILNFASEQKAVFIKLLVLLQWSKNVQDVSKTISLNWWLQEQRDAYSAACNLLYTFKFIATSWQTPNPDIRTAGEILSLQRAASLSNLGYHKTKRLSKRRMISTLHRLNNILTARLALEPLIPKPIRTYRIHDGRVTFTVPNEFEVDLSILEEDDVSPYRAVDFRFLIKPSPKISVNLRAHVESQIDAKLASDGLAGCYEFLHQLSLSNHLSELHRQALDLARNQWAGSLRVELIRRSLIIQYWAERRASKSWLEIGIYSSDGGATAQDNLRSSYLGYRWYREGKRIDDFTLNVTSSSASLDVFLNQVVAQHCTHILDAIYDKLASSDLFRTTDLLLEQESSYESPQDCFLRIGTGKETSISVSIGAVDGIAVVSPASERTNRFQLDLNRSKNLVEEFTTKFSHFRCVVAEGVVRSSTSGSLWQALPAFRPKLSESRRLFGSNVSRTNFFAHPTWAGHYLLAIAYRSTGDTFSVIQLDSGGALLAGARVVHTEPLSFDSASSAEYFTDLFQYASKVVALDKIIQSAQQEQTKLTAPQLSMFGSGHSSPTFSVQVGLPPLVATEARTFVKLRFLDTDPSTQEARILVQLKCFADAGVMKRLSDSSPSASIEFSPQNHQLALHLSLTFDEIRLSNITQQIRRLHDVVMTAQALERTPFVTITNLSFDAMELAYKFDKSEEWSLKLQAPTDDSGARVTFLPSETNPCTCLNGVLSEMLNNTKTAFVSRLRDMLGILSIMSPLLTKLRELQNSSSQHEADASVKQPRLHVLVRQPTMLALQYYTVSDVKQDAAIDAASASKLLARFEILPLEGAKSMFAIRHAIEELSSYQRPSYASNAVRDKVKQGIFQNITGSRDWLCYDTAAGFLASQPEQILDALHQIMIECANLPAVEADGAKDDGAKVIDATQSRQQGPSNGIAPKSAPQKPQQNSKAPVSQQQKHKQQPPMAKRGSFHKTGR